MADESTSREAPPSGPAAKTGESDRCRPRSSMGLMRGKFHIARMNNFHRCSRLHSDPRSSPNPPCPCYKSPFPRWKFHIALHCSSSPGNRLAYFALLCSVAPRRFSDGRHCSRDGRGHLPSWAACVLAVLERQLKYCNYNDPQW